MADFDIFKIDGQAFNLPILSYDFSYEILDSEATGRTQGVGWPMFREPQGVIINIEQIVFAKLSSNDPGFVALIKTLLSFGAVGSDGFKEVTFLSPLGVITQPMYAAGTFKVQTKRIVSGDEIYYGTMPVKFIAKRAYYT